MNTILVTGADGFIGRNLIERLGRIPENRILKIDVDQTEDELKSALEISDAVFHLAGVNRPEREEEFTIGNADLTSRIVSLLLKRNTKPLLVLSSSIQAEQDNAYGRSKRKAEEAVEEYGRSGANAIIFRLSNVFGKWSRPNYNSAVATFCYNIAREIPVTISDPARSLDLVYVGDVVEAFISQLESQDQKGTRRLSVPPIAKVSLTDLIRELQEMHDIRNRLVVPDFSDRFRRCLYATYLSFLPQDGLGYELSIREDQRGSLAEFLRSSYFGQIFISRTKPGVMRGNHYHDNKVEKFLVVEGNAVIRFRHISGSEILEYPVAGKDFRVVDIPPGYTHTIENVGASELVVLFWSIEPFDPNRPDTYPLGVIQQ